MNSKQVHRDVSLEIKESYMRDVGRGIARIDEMTMDSLSIAIGDIIEITGKRKAVAKCLPLFPSDVNKNRIRFDGLTRYNSSTEICDVVSIRKIKPKTAKLVKIVPLDDVPPLEEGYLTKALIYVPFIKNQVIMAPYRNGRLAFGVIEIIPEIENDEVLMVEENTKFLIKNKERNIPWG